jgi:hypothetical protein
VAERETSQRGETGVRSPALCGLVCFAIGLISLFATSFIVHAFLPPAIPDAVASKLKFFTKHKDEFDTLFLGTSRFYYSVSPEIFDRTTAENGLSTRTFNFGIDGMHPPENFYVLEQILKTKPRNLKRIFFEVGDIQTNWTSSVYTSRRITYWHDWARTVITLRKAFNPHGRAKWYVKITRLWLARRDFAANLALLGKQFGNVGRGADLFLSRDDESTKQSESDLGIKHDGYRSSENAMSAERGAIFQRKLAQEMFESHPKFIDPYAEEAYRDSAARLRRAGIESLFVVTPVIWQSPLRFRKSPAPGPLLSFNDCKTYPSLYETRVRVDEGHLTREGAERFTRLLAHELVRHDRQR